MDETLGSDGGPSPSQWQRFVTPDGNTPACQLWTGSYRKVGKGESVRKTPVIYYDNSRTCARVTVAAHHGLCSFADNVAIFMQCHNRECVAPHHMRVVQRLVRVRTLKRPRSDSVDDTHSATGTCTEDDVSVSYSSSGSGSSSSSSKRMRGDSELSGAPPSEHVPVVDRNTIAFYLQQWDTPTQ